MEERIGFLKRVSGHTFDTIYDLVFTEERVIALIVEHPGDIPHKFGITEMLFGQLGKQGERVEKKKIAEERRALYERKAVDELAGLHRLNFEIYYREIASAEVSSGLLQSSLKFRLSAPSRENTVIRFRLKRNQAEEARSLVARAMPAKLK